MEQSGISFVNFNKKKVAKCGARDINVMKITSTCITLVHLAFG